MTIRSHVPIHSFAPIRSHVVLTGRPVSPEHLHPPAIATYGPQSGISSNLLTVAYLGVLSWSELGSPNGHIRLNPMQQMTIR